jgi:hypothetical protein
MKLAILQPNFFPYQAYYDLVQRVDKVIFIDDTPYNSKNWVNKTLLKVKNKNFYFRIPTAEFSKDDGSFVLTKDLTVRENKWRKKFLRLITVQYKNYPNFKYVFPIIEEITQMPMDNISNISAYSVYRIAHLLNPNIEFAFSSKKYGNIKKRFADKIIDICKKEKATSFYTFSRNRDSFDDKKFLHNDIRISYFKSYSNNVSIIESLMSDNSYLKNFRKECNLFQHETK